MEVVGWECREKPADVGAWVFVLEKLCFDRYGFTKSDTWVFESFWAANRAMFDDWIEEYQGYLDQYVLKDGESFDKDKHDPDGFWKDQVRPSVSDDSSVISFPENKPGEGRVEWHIFKRKVEGASESWK